MERRSLYVRKLVFSALCLALAYVLPFLTGQLQSFGNALCPMHIPVLLCGFICGWPWGLAVGMIAPLLRSVTLGMPPMILAISMAFELAVYGAVSGYLYHKLPKKKINIYYALIAAMIAGRIVWGIVKFAIAGFSSTAFPLSAFLAGAVTSALPGIAIQIIFIPIIVMSLRKSGLMLND